VEYEPEAEAAHWWKDVDGTLARLRTLQESFGATDPWDSEHLEESLRRLAIERGEGAAKLIHPLRVAVTGRSVSPGIFDVLTVLGKDRAMARIGAGLDRLENRENRRS
jgi:glutamyl-tRNA synthetase